MNAAIYARFSTEEQDPRSVADQIRRCTECAVSKGYEVVATFSDAAISGSHTDRAGFQKMLAAATKARRSPFAAVVVDDLSRLSRNMGDTWRTIDDLAACGVCIIDAQTGMASDAKEARQMFGMKAMFADHMLEQIRYQTHRGLTGRALDGFSTGGSLYGYRTVAEDSNVEFPRKRWVIDKDESKIVVRIYREYNDGAGSLKSIADRLNQDGVEPPRNNGRGRKHGHGWAHSTVRAILISERYAGTWRWNTTKWIRVPGKRARRQVARPKTEHIKHDYPELAIIPRDMWDRVQARFKRHHKKMGRPVGSGKTHYLLAGLLRCGTCSGPMSIASAKVKNGVRYANFGCTAHASRGSSICDNAMTISDKKISEAFLAALRETLSSPEVAEMFVASFRKHVAKPVTKDSRKDLEQQLAEAMQRVRNVTAAIARRPESAALDRQLDDEEQTVARLKRELATATPAKAARPLPTPQAIRAGLGRFVTELADLDAEQGRERLARSMPPLVLTPKSKSPGRGFHVTGTIALSGLVPGKSSSGGAQPDLSGQAIPTASLAFFVDTERRKAA